MRSIADQSVGELGGHLSVLARQKGDHIKLNRLLEDLEGTSGTRQELVLLRICRLVFPHAFAEESVLWPVMRRALPEGNELTLEVEREHQEVNELVTALEELEEQSPRRSSILDRLVIVLREDVRDEEDVLFPRLQASLTGKQLRGLGVAWELVRRTAPTRAHPVVARRPPGNLIAAIPLSLIDRARDLVDFAALTGPARAVPALHTLSRGLTRGAHRVERLPLMRRGEHHSTRAATV
ncbi:MAG: cation-binding protein [Microbacteriaceae bacterium]|jgi:hemerythrin superfamily protein|nr:cation-binding protein [Microbacteriaceae bacterium]